MLTLRRSVGDGSGVPRRGWNWELSAPAEGSKGLELG